MSNNPNFTPPGQDPSFVPPGQGGTPPGQASCFIARASLKIIEAEIECWLTMSYAECPEAHLVGMGMPFWAPRPRPC